MANRILRNALPAIIAACLVVPAHATEPARQPATINVSATGTASVAPDLAVVSFSVISTGKTARETLSENNTLMAKVLASMKEAGIEDRDLQTSGFSIQPSYRDRSKSSASFDEPPLIVGYTVSNSLTVRVRKLDLVGELLDRAVTLGINSGGNIQFSNDNPEETLKEARIAAMKMAIEQAKTLTEAAGVRLGRIMNISEQGGFQPRYRAARAQLQDAAGAVPVASGENDYNVTVNVTWEIDQ